MRGFVLGCVLLVACGVRLDAQKFTAGPCAENSQSGGDKGWFASLLTSGQEHACEVRSATLPLVGGQVNVRGKNGDIEVVGEDRGDVLLEARVTAQAGSKDEAQGIVREIRIETSGTIEAKGPENLGGRRGWSVNFRLRVPRRVSARLETGNGGIKLANLDGVIQARATNGGVSVKDLAGDVHVITVNGGLTVTLRGDRWRGNGLVAETTNGGVSVAVPNGYSAHLVAGTVNGGVRVGIPLSGSGPSRTGLDTNVGQGGATLRFETVNGGVSIDRD